jgi:hypothetical protein
MPKNKPEIIEEEDQVEVDPWDEHAMGAGDICEFDQDEIEEALDDIGLRARQQIELYYGG